MKILLTIDTEFYISKEEILGVKGQNGIDDILKILSTNDVIATFFVDYFSIEKWGEKIFRDITDKINSVGHDIQLHLHPHIVGGKNWMWQYDEKMQSDLLDRGIRFFEKFNGKKPLHFRAGGYGANDVTLKLLQDKGFEADHSFQFKQKRCRISPAAFPFINKVARTGKIWQIPTNIYKYYYPLPRYNSVNFEWCSLAELKTLSRMFKKSGSRHFVLMMHSFGLLNRHDRTRLRASRMKKNRLHAFIVFAKNEGIGFQTVPDFMKEIDKHNKMPDFMPVIKNPFTVLSGLIIRFLNFWQLKKTFRIKATTIATLASLILSLILYLCLFDFIEPSVKKYDKVNVDIDSWNKDGDIHSIEEYFIVIPQERTNFRKREDASGILQRQSFPDYRKYIVEDRTIPIYVPTDMSGAIISLFNHHSELNKQDSIRIKRYADWLSKNTQYKDNFAVWPHPYGFSKYNLNQGWAGAWAQGSILSAISRYYLFSGDSTFLSLGKKAVLAFKIPHTEGGLLATETGFEWFYEEYPSSPESHVLNGHINALLGLYDFWRATGDHLALDLFNKGVEAALIKLDDYDMGYWSRYDLDYPYATDYYYHCIVHIPQLRVLYQITKKRIFLEYADRWEAFKHDKFSYQLFKIRILFDALHRRFTYKSFFSTGK